MQNQKQHPIVFYYLKSSIFVACNKEDEIILKKIAMSRKIRHFVLTIILGLLLWQCARRGSPTGGPKDEMAPVLLEAFPPSETTRFDKNKIRFIFDELVITKDLRKQLIISPPLENFPTVSPSSASKKLDFTLTDTLKPNTTYVFNFGNSIQDYNEGNPYRDFKYVFSTGDLIDSLQVQGKIKDALKAKPDNFVTVMLYEYNEAYKDSLVYKSKPTYITNTLDSLDTFELNYIKEGKYVLIALKDKNGNYLFDQKDDKIAFHNEPITVSRDSLPSYELNLFKEIKNYKASRPTQASENRILFGFEGKIDSVKIKPISSVPEKFTYTISKEPQKDSLNFWFAPKIDSLTFTVENTTKIDTFKIRLRKMKPDSLQISNSFSGDFPIDKHFHWKSNIPIVKTDSSKLKIIGKDSISIPFKAQLNADKLEYSLIFNAKHGETYQIHALPEAMVDFFGNTNDTLKVNLKTKKIEDYSVFKLKLNGAFNFPLIMQLTNEKEDIIEKELYAETPLNQYIFENINPGKYKLRIIEDRNKNHVWDTGNFLKHIQPEKIIHYPSLIELRANWEVEENFTL